jgi:hypothetical protein
MEVFLVLNVKHSLLAWPSNTCSCTSALQVTYMEHVLAALDQVSPIPQFESFAAWLETLLQATTLVNSGLDEITDKIVTWPHHSVLSYPSSWNTYGIPVKGGHCQASYPQSSALEHRLVELQVVRIAMQQRQICKKYAQAVAN